MYYPSGENIGADQLCSYCIADLRLCFRIGKNPVFSDGAHMCLRFHYQRIWFSYFTACGEFETISKPRQSSKDPL